MRVTGVEPARPRDRRILSPFPVPFGHTRRAEDKGIEPPDLLQPPAFQAGPTNQHLAIFLGASSRT